jgi:hypothetical protein
VKDGKGDQLAEIYDFSEEERELMTNDLGLPGGTI